MVPLRAGFFIDKCEPQALRHFLRQDKPGPRFGGTEFVKGEYARQNIGFDTLVASLGERLLDQLYDVIERHDAQLHRANFLLLPDVSWYNAPMHALHLIATLLSILVAITLVVVLYLTRGIVLPFLVALFLAYLLDPVIRFLTRLRFPLWLAVCIALFGTFVLLALLGTLFYASVQSFVKEYPRYEPKLRELVTTVTAQLDIPLPDWQVADLGKKLASTTVAKAVLSSLGPFFAFVGRLLLVFLFMVFILLGHQSLPARIHRAFGEADGQRITQVLQRTTRQAQTYLGAKALISLVTGVLVNLVLLVFDIDFAVLWGTLAFLLNFIPHIGSIVAAIPPILVAVLKFDTLMPAVWVTVSIIAINTILGGLIEPRLMGQRLNLSPLLVIFSLLFWGWLWGIAGMILAVPIMATIKIICENIPRLRFVSLLMSGK